MSCQPINLQPVNLKPVNLKPSTLNLQPSTTFNLQQIELIMYSAPLIHFY
ncbi:MAG: hypothetical protein F6K50_49820 [Moorea sp. SIO3I7]|nr:hypothetical protein [Moorena sp. SIO3I7]